MPAPLIGLPALLQTLATVGVGGAVGYKAQKDLQPYIKQLKSSPEDMDTPQLKMLRALLLPNQAIAAEAKDLISKSAPELTGSGQVFGPKIGDIEKVQEEIKQVTKPPITSTPIKPITTETFPAEPQQKPEPPVQPEIDVETKEEFPDFSGEVKPIIFYNKTKEYEGPILETGKLDDKLMEGIQKYAGSREDIIQSSKMPQSHKKKIFFALEEAIQEKYPTKLSSEEENLEGDALFYITQSVYDSYLRKDGQLPNNVVMAQDEAGIPLAAANIEVFPKGKVSFYPKRKVKRVKTEPAIYIETIGSLNREATENVLNQIEKLADAQGIRYIVAEDLTSEAAEKAFEKRGFVPAKKGFFEGEQIKTADWRGGKTIIQKNMVLDLGKKNETTETEIGEEVLKEQPQAPAIVGTKAQEGGKQIKDITAGFSTQKDIVPSLLEQGKAAAPMKNFFEKDTNVINYKIGDTIGAYGGDVERSLDIEANVKPDFNIDSFSEVIKQGAKEYNQDAVFVAESAPPEKANTVGFSIDFGSNLNIADALEVSKRISDTAQLDGFTFKVKNLDTSGASIYLPQTEKDIEMTQKAVEKFKPTDQINLAGFLMPDGKMLNFSRSGNVRDTEHRRVGLVTHPGSDGVSFGPMYDFMNKTGAIRLAGNTNRLYAEISSKPSAFQIKKIVDEYNKNRDRYDSLTIALAMPKTEGALGGVKPEEAIDLSKMTYRLPNEAFIEVNGKNANANDIFKKFQAADVMGKTFTGIRQLNIPEFSGMSPKDAARKIVNLGNNMSKIIEETGIKTLDKPKTKSYNVKLFQKGKDY